MVWQSVDMWGQSLSLSVSGWGDVKTWYCQTWLTGWLTGCLGKYKILTEHTALQLQVKLNSLALQPHYNMYILSHRLIWTKWWFSQNKFCSVFEWWRDGACLVCLGRCSVQWWWAGCGLLWLVVPCGPVEIRILGSSWPPPTTTSSTTSTTPTQRPVRPVCSAGPLGGGHFVLYVTTSPLSSLLSPHPTPAPHPIHKEPGQENR